MRIAYVVGHYPLASETFIAREIEALTARGASVGVFRVYEPRHERWLARAEDGYRGDEEPRWLRGLRAPKGGLAAWLMTRSSEMVGALVRRPLFTLQWSARLLASVHREGRKALRAIRYLPAAEELIQVLRRERVTRIHAHFAGIPSTVAWVAAAEVGVPFSFSVHARDAFVEPQFVAEKARAADRVFVCNSAAAERLAAMVGPADRPKVALVPHGVPLRRYPLRADPPAGPPLILGVGRLVEKKGFIHLVRAIARLKQAGIEARCCILGEGPERPYLHREIAAAGLRDTIAHTGWLPEEEVLLAYARARVLAVPSVVARDGDRDGLPNVALEAAAIGLPIVATSVGGIGDLVRDGETGLVAREGDAEDLAEKILAVLKDPEGAMARARRAREEVEARFDQEQCIRRLLALLGASASPGGG